jgi:hypothetical protein
MRGSGGVIYCERSEFFLFSVLLRSFFVSGVEIGVYILFFIRLLNIQLLSIILSWPLNKKIANAKVVEIVQFSCSFAY